MQLRLRFYTTDRTKTGKLIAVVLDTVLRTEVKYQYDLSFRLLDNDVNLRGEETGVKAFDLLKVLKEWSYSDDDNFSGILHMRCNNPLYDDRYVFLNSIHSRALKHRPDPNVEERYGYYCTTSGQSA